MVRNALHTKERADFAFGIIQKYYEQHAYAQALDSIKEHKDLTGSALNVGSQLKLARMFTDSIVQLMHDAFEVDGDLKAFSAMLTEHHTHLELHAKRSVFDAFLQYQAQKDQHPMYRSRKERFNQTVDPISAQFDAPASVVRPASVTQQQRADITRDFLDSIEKPSFHFSPLSAEELSKSSDTVIRSQVDVKAVHEDFFSAIAEPGKSNSSQPQASASQYANQRLAQEPHADRRIKPLDLSERSAASRKTRAQEQSIASSNIRETKEIVQNGERYTQTTHKSGGKVTEFVISEPSTHPADSSAAHSSTARKSKTSRTDSAQARTHPSSTARKQGSSARTSARNRKKSARRINPVLAVFALFMAVLLGLGVPRILDRFRGSESGTPASELTTPAPGSDDSATEAIDDPDDAAEPGPAEPEIEVEPDYILPSDTRILEASDLEGMTRSDIRYAINEMFARHGWHFNGTGDFFNYFSEKDWYEPDFTLTQDSQAERKFSDLERQNLRTLVDMRSRLS